jgi:superfamily II DNA/RNA helicase
VHDLFSSLAPSCGLRVGLAAAQSSLADEAAALVGPPGSLAQGVDVLVATPGRLMAHLHSTAGVTLRVGGLRRQLPGLLGGLPAHLQPAALPQRICCLLHSS